MNHQFDLVGDQHHQLEEVAGPVSSGEQVTLRVVIELDPGDGVPLRVPNVLVGDLMAPGRSIKFHTQ